MPGVFVVVRMLRVEVNVKFGSGDAAALAAVDVQMVPVQMEFGQRMLQAVRIEPQIQQGSDKHVTADTAE